MWQYFKHVFNALKTFKKGFYLTIKHLIEARQSRGQLGIMNENYFVQQTGIATLQYPKETIPVPDNGRYRLHNEIDDCIVCDKCAKICPVNCIEIEPVRSVKEIGRTSNDTSKRLYPAIFNIDMGKCCFCGLCTTVCPTECLTMTKVYDFSEPDIRNHNFAFSEMTPLEILEKKSEFEKSQAEKQAKKALQPNRKTPSTGLNPNKAKVGLKLMPIIKTKKT